MENACGQPQNGSQKHPPCKSYEVPTLYPKSELIDPVNNTAEKHNLPCKQFLCGKDFRLSIGSMVGSTLITHKTAVGRKKTDRIKTARL